MKTILSALAIILYLGVATSGFAGDSYLCITDKASGFLYDKDTKEWKSAEFEPGEKYILKKSKKTIDVFTPDAEVGDFLIYNLESSFSAGYCSKIASRGYIYDCKLWTGIAKFNEKKMIFLKVYTPGYWDNSTLNTPYMEIGKCSPFNK